MRAASRRGRVERRPAFRRGITKSVETSSPGTTLDQQRFEQLITARHPCVLICTTEEDAALGIIRASALERGTDILLWSITRGVHDGLMAESVSITDTEHPAAALYYFARSSTRRCILVMLDVIGHLKDERTLR